MTLRPLFEVKVTIKGDNGTKITETIEEDSEFDIAALIDNNEIEVINDITVKVEGNTQQNTGVIDGDTINLTDNDLTGSNILSSANIFGINGSIPEYGTGYISGPNDELNGSGYYSNIVNQISDHGTGYINGPNDELSGSGYYSNIKNNIPDRGSLDDLTPGSSAYSGYYSAGTVPEGGGVESIALTGDMFKIIDVSDEDGSAIIDVNVSRETSWSNERFLDSHEADANDVNSRKFELRYDGSKNYRNERLKMELYRPQFEDSSWVPDWQGWNPDFNENAPDEGEYMTYWKNINLDDSETLEKWMIDTNSSYNTTLSLYAEVEESTCDVSASLE